MQAMAVAVLQVSSHNSWVTTLQVVQASADKPTLEVAIQARKSLESQQTTNLT